MREERIGKLLSFITLKQSITRWSSTIRAAPSFLSPNAALRVRQPQEKVAGRGSADGLIREKVAGEVLADGLNQEMVAGRGSADGLKQEKVAGRGSADILHCLSQENSSPPIIRAVYRRKIVRRVTNMMV